MARILVTGGSGFIGTHLINALLARSDAVSNVDIRPPALDEHQPYWTRLDILDDAALSRHVEAFKPDVIFNLAAVADISLPLEAFRTNTVGLRNVLESAERLAPRPRVIHTSTQMVAGPGYQISGPRDYDPYTPYGTSKAESEEILWKWEGDLEWTIVRPTIVWGAWHPTMAPSTFRYLKRRWYMIPTGKDPIRTYSYVGNLVDQLIAVADAEPSRVNRQMFYGGDAPIPTSRWLDTFSRALSGRPTRRVPYALLNAVAWVGEMMGRLGGPSPLNRGRLYRMTSDYAVPVEPTFAAFGEPRIPLEQGVRETVEWLQARYGTKL